MITNMHFVSNKIQALKQSEIQTHLIKNKYNFMNINYRSEILIHFMNSSSGKNTSSHTILSTSSLNPSNVYQC